MKSNVTINDIQAMIQRGDTKGALKNVSKLLKKQPKHAGLFNLMGIALLRQGDVNKAVSAFKKAAAFKPTEIDGHRNLVQALIQIGQIDEAVEFSERAYERATDKVNAAILKANASRARGDFDKALTYVNDALNNDPLSTSALLLRSAIFQNLHRAQDAIADLKQILRQDVAHAGARTQLAELLAFAGKVDTASDLLREGIRSGWQTPEMFIQLAALDHARGDRRGAISHYKEALSLNPLHPLALNGLAYLLDPSSSDAMNTRAKLVQVRSEVPAKSDLNALLGFGIAKLTPAEKRDVALEEANQRASEVLKYDASAYRNEQDELLQLYAHNPTSFCSSHRPIFVVGLMRSGTTLLEQILNSHAEIVGVGELVAGWQSVQRWCEKDIPWSSSAASDLAKHYTSHLPETAAGTRIVDKMPDNWRILGYLADAFPKATFVEMQRDPRDIAISMWESFFPTTAHAYASRFDWMGQHFNLYQETMQSWREIIRDSIITIKYEDLVRTPSTVVESLCANLGLDFDPSMLDLEHSKGTVLTASVAQVRKKITPASVGRWKHRETLISPLVETLDPNLWHLDQG